ncbi:MDR family MFS transporter [Virgisporangium aurantiacum]|uniref:Major facilitator superfamily (MFS) profile domain-containing protein n=1 Tax=Virgisporangium aurantiacum TaxID=175570 RepID=A0A8J3Z7P3_9ACTN|nr:MDR family MFS transporter [Virgisporangium aurantiacum]GIJ58904.1 hypothetical protein Vau01_064200 [Virgisporangium aurantiacum]
MNPVNDCGSVVPADITDTTGHNTTDEAREPLRRGSLSLVMTAVLLSTCLAALDQTIMAAALPTIVGQLHGFDVLSWVFTAYVITAGVSTPLYGKLVDMYGRRPLYLFALITFLAGSLFAGVAQSMMQLIVFRAVQGLGAGGILVLSLVVIADVVPFKQRGKYMGLYGAVLGVASIGGPILGGFFTDHLTWRWVFFINLPLGALALAIMLIALRLPRKRTSHRVDILGFLLLAGTATCVTLFTSWGGTRYAWSSTMIIGLAVASLVLFTLFILAERTAVEPLIPLRLFRNRTIALACVANMLIFTVVNGAATFMPMFLQLVSGRTATDTGLLTIPMVAGLMFSSVVGGGLITKLERYKWSPVLGCLLATVDTFLFSTMHRNTPWFLVITYFVVFGLALGLVMQPLTLGVQATAPEQDLGVATATAAFSQRIGGAFGLAALGALFASRLSAELAVHVPAGAAAQLTGATSQISPEQVRALGEPLRGNVQNAFMDSISTVFLWSVPVMALAFVLTLFLKNIRLTETEVRSELETLGV